MSGKDPAAPSKGQNQKNKPKLRNAEKLAVNQRLTMEDLLRDFLRQELAPDPNDGNNYYLGKVLKVFEANQDNTSIYNIFDDSINNMERFYTNYKTSDKFITKRLLVHIPELYSTNEFSDDNIFTRYTKFKINYRGKEVIKEHDIVKIIFKNSSNYTDPEIISIHRSDGSANYETELAQIANDINSANQCRILQLNNPGSPTLNLANTYLSSPVAGYFQLFEDFKFILSNDGYNTFIRQQGPNLNPTFKEIFNLKYEIYADQKVKSLVSSEYPKLQNSFVEDSKINPVLEDTRSDVEVVFRLKLDSNQNINQKGIENLLNKYYDFIQAKIDRYKFVITKSAVLKIDQKTTFYIDISVDIVAIEDQNLVNATLDKYIEFSNKAKNGAIQVSTSFTIQTSQNSSQTLQQNSTPDPCENSQPTVTDIYISTDQPQKWTRILADAPFVNHFLNTIVGGPAPLKYSPRKYVQKNTDDILDFENLKISGERISKKESTVFYTFEELQSINPKFYSIPQKIQQRNSKEKRKVTIKSDFKDQNKTNFISEDSLNFRIQQISNFLKNLKDLIVQNEQVPPNNVLVLPLNVIRPNRGQNTDSESRHYYGQAVDFVVYVNFSNDVTKTQIFQIPPEIVYLYCMKLAELQSFVENCGNGIFIKDSYNHFEFLLFPADEQNPKDAKSSLSADERKNGRLWVSGADKDKLKDIDKLKNSEKHKLLIDYISKNYAKINTANPVSKILRLL